MTFPAQDGEAKLTVPFRSLNLDSAHPGVIYTINKYGNAASSEAMLDEEPHKSEDGRLAYWQSLDKKARNLATVTTLGRYIRRHWPQEAISDHAVRDIVALHEPSKIRHLITVDEMVDAVQRGPYSCMQWKEEDGWFKHEDASSYQEAHPYHVYLPQYGWSMYIRLDDSKIVGRCLVNTLKDRKVYVRSYSSSTSDNYSGTDQQLEAYLNDKGFKKLTAWPEGLKLDLIDYRNENGYILPYLDPGSTTADAGAHNLSKEGDCWVRDNRGEYLAESTDGTYEEGDPGETCDGCGDLEDSDNMNWVGRQESSRICDHCLQHHYQRVIGQNQHNYIVRDNDAVIINGVWYDSEFLSDNDIVKLHDGDYAKGEDAVYVSSEDEYYLYDAVGSGKDTNALVVKLESDEYELTADSFWCESNEEWYSKMDNHYVELLNGDYVCRDDFVTYITETMEYDDKLSDFLSPEDTEKWAGKVKRELDSCPDQAELVLDPADKVTAPETGVVKFCVEPATTTTEETHG